MLAPAMLLVALPWSTIRGGGPSDPKPAQSRVELVTDVQSIRAGQAFTVAVRLAPAKGWHTYWSNPGDSGSPTSVRWRLPAGWHTGPLRWPAPHRFEFAGVVCYGYDEDTLVLLDVTPPKSLEPGSKATLAGEVKWLVCTPQICTPGNGAFNLTLPVKASPPRINVAWRQRFADAARSVPTVLEGWQARARLRGGAIELDLTGSGPLLERSGNPYFFPQDVGVVSHSKPETFSFSQSGLVAHLPVSEYSQHTPTRLRGVLEAPSGETWMGHGHAVSIDVPIQSQ